MGRRFIQCDRDQQMLLPPDLRSWLPPDHQVWMVIGVVEELDLDVFYEAARRQPRSRPPYQPRMLLGLLVYGYAVGVRSSREIERRCETDVAFRVITAQERPDHATIARFRVQHAARIAGLFVQVLGLCRAAGLGKLGQVAIDGTKLAAPAARHRNRDRVTLLREQDRLERLVAGMLAEAEQVDAAEDALYGDKRGDELPPELADPEQRKRVLADAKRRLAKAEQAQAAADHSDAAAGAAHEARIVEARAAGRSRPAQPKPVERVNLTDPDSRLLQRADHGWIQGYTGQLVVSDDHLVLATGVCTDPTDHHQLAPMLAATRDHLERAGFTEPVGYVTADHGYFTNANAAERGDGVTLLIAPGNPRRTTPDPSLAACAARSRLADRLTQPGASDAYRRRQATVEPVIGTITNTRNGRRLSRRGLDAARHEWAFHGIVHNLLRLITVTAANAAQPAR
jgi:transposase